MGNYTIFTNNSIVVEHFDKAEAVKFEMKWVSAPAMEVLSAAKTAARLGAVLLSNPMAGVRTAGLLFEQPAYEKTSRPSPPKIKSINPYLSVLVGSGSGMVDFQSIKDIDEALNLYKKNARLRFLAHNDDTIKAFQAMDLESLVNTLTALESLGNL